MIESILPVLLAFVSLGAFELGTRVRERVHVVMPYKDPVTLLIFSVCLSPVIAAWFGYGFMDPGNIWYISFIIASLSCYSLAYIRGELDMVYVNVHTIRAERRTSSPWSSIGTRTVASAYRSSRSRRSLRRCSSGYVPPCVWIRG